MDAAEIRSHPAFDGRWYYRLELAPGLWTPGRDHNAVTQTRGLLRRVEVAGARCLDVGLQEGMVSILMERRGAAEVVGYDRVLRQGRLRLVKRALDANFDLIGGMKLQDFPAALVEAERDPFDLVVFSGVLYHMFDPLGGIAVVRGLVRNGGICLVETAVAFEDSDSMLLNSRARFTHGAVWFVTPSCLDYMLRLLRFEPLDVVYMRTGDKQGRLAVACRAVTEAVAEPDDEWIGRERLILSEFLDWGRVASDTPPVGYEAREGLVRGRAGSVDLHASVAATDPFVVEPERTRLGLADRF